jgi:hypothetical protein
MRLMIPTLAAKYSWTFGLDPSALQALPKLMTVGLEAGHAAGGKQAMAC